MLPSTFFENSYDNATLSRKLKAKQEMASFFQEVVQRRTKQILQEEVIWRVCKYCETQKIRNHVAKRVVEMYLIIGTYKRRTIRWNGILTYVYSKKGAM